MNWKIAIGALLIMSAIRGFYLGGEDVNTAITSLILGVLLLNWHYKFHQKLLRKSRQKSPPDSIATHQIHNHADGSIGGGSTSDTRLFVALAQSAQTSPTIEDLNELCSRLLEELGSLNVHNKEIATAYLTDCQILIDQENTDWDEFFDGIKDTSTDILIFLENMASDEGFDDPKSYVSSSYDNSNSLIIHLAVNYCIANAAQEVVR